ncbi:hypothetical protein FOA52_005088 [Chlamydomonas sp. UWO 241]|nr:hypothetical protein FOA52_005088 [Chlamydomonas sp. UWO 241]
MAPGGTRPALCLLPVGDRCLDLCLGGAVGASHLLSRDHTCALMGVVPPLESLRPWELSFSTRQHGVSLATLFRRSGRSGPTLLVVRDTGGHVFGCYSADGWRLSTRFYGNGQTCVFQLEPHRVAWPWDSSPGPTKNDFYMHGTPERLVVGASAGGQCAIYLDGDLLRGSSGACSTFGSPCLASNNEFTIQHVEVWQVAVG